MKRIAFLAAALLLTPRVSAFAQTGPTGTTSGPASGTPATLGTGGQTPATPHQADLLKNAGNAAALKGEQQGQVGGTSAAPAKPGTEGGPAPAKKM